MKTLSEIEAAADAYIATLQIAHSEMWQAIRQAYIDGIISGKTND